MGDKDNDGGSGRAHRMISVEDAHNAVHEESMSRSSHRNFPRGSSHMSKEIPLTDAADETTEIAHSNADHDRSVHPVPRCVEMPMVVHTAHGGYQSCSRDRMNRCTQRFHNAVEMDHYNDLGGEDLRNAAHWESLDETSCAKLETRNGVQNRTTIRLQRVAVVCLE